MVAYLNHGNGVGGGGGGGGEGGERVSVGQAGYWSKTCRRVEGPEVFSYSQVSL